ncbi:MULTISPECIES: tyrosine-type recombinase/integrase [unclassified Micromonospora]|uniref:tyrosine-type recombinase/integrase n=1 Tax=unclassified Micromonospora TaxID=2617518 RepID=UPI00098D3683|nr:MULTISPECIES: tyrosine-type recombinase/integrase [unclassified Micromonospora]MDI5938842.1 tyrosine-type recombinase/integrase [Micromonospora sp. DH15]OON33080.1 site-specific integrase [Micromonospora sp. Rc5]
MANKDGHRRFGNLRKLPSGRYQARYPGPDGRMRNAPETFTRKSDADRYLTLVEAQMVRREWVDPDLAKVRLDDYARRWIEQRPNLRPRTVHLYGWLLEKHIVPYLGGTELGRLDTPMVRDWRAKLLGNGVSVSMAAKAYRLLRAVLMTAVKEDQILTRNPCQIPGADQEKAAERPVLTLAQVFKLADIVPPRYRALVLVTAFGCLRWGEVSALQRQDIDTTAGTIRIRQAYTEQRGVGLVLGPPKSRAGRRTVTLPPAVVEVVRDHLAAEVDDTPDAFVFTTESGRPIWRGNLNKIIAWKASVTRIGQPNLHFHDLRHTGNTLAARTGASTRDLMARMGHDSPQAALIYQHATAEADRAIAQALHEAVRADRKKGKKSDTKGKRKDKKGKKGGDR